MPFSLTSASRYVPCRSHNASAKRQSSPAGLSPVKRSSPKGRFDLFQALEFRYASRTALPRAAAVVEAEPRVALTERELRDSAVPMAPAVDKAAGRVVVRAAAVDNVQPARAKAQRARS